jgi:HlyD family secretion protein
MNLQSIHQSILHAVRRPIVLGLVGLAALALVITMFTTSGPPPQDLSTFEVKRSDFLVSVVEGGTLEAVDEVSIRSEVEGVARIIYIVAEGSYVKKGDLLVELDSSSSQDAVNLQEINVEKAQFGLVQAEQQLAIQKSVGESDTQAATLKVEFAASDLEKFIKGEALQAQRNAEIEITNVLENLQIAQERLDWSEKLYKEGFETKGNLDKDRLTLLQTKLKLEQTQKALWMVEVFDNPKRKRLLESTLQEAQENLDRTKLQGERKLAQASADVATQKRTLELSETKLERDKKQLLATKICAPQDGLVVYGSSSGGHFSSESMIEEGAVVRNRQEIIKLPDVAEMKLVVKIHESHINQLHLGQPAYVVLDSMPDQRLSGKVHKIAPLPDSSSRWGNPDLKVYVTEILVTDKLPDIKPGVSARAEIVITNLTDTLAVPIQAVTTRKGKRVVFLASAPQKPAPIEVGMYNTKFIQITSGLKDGDRVLLAPPFDAKEKDLGGAIIGDGEPMPQGLTNQIARGVIRAPAGRDEPARRGRDESPTNTIPQEIIKQFDADGDGKLNQAEQAAMRDWQVHRQDTNSSPTAPLLN